MSEVLIIDTLKELTDEQFKNFKRELLIPANLEGQQAVAKNNLNKDRNDTMDLILQKYPNNVDQIMVNILKRIDIEDLQEKFLDNIRSKGAAASVPAPPKGEAASDPKIAFLKQHQIALIQRVTTVAPILDLLYNKEVLTPEAYSDLTSERTTQEKMRKLFVILNSKGDAAKHLFFEGLEENEKFLLGDLNYAC